MEHAHQEECGATGASGTVEGSSQAEQWENYDHTKCSLAINKRSSTTYVHSRRNSEQMPHTSRKHFSTYSRSQAELHSLHCFISQPKETKVILPTFIIAFTNSSHCRLSWHPTFAFCCFIGSQTPQLHARSHANYTAKQQYLWAWNKTKLNRNTRLYKFDASLSNLPHR